MTSGPPPGAGPSPRRRRALRVLALAAAYLAAASASVHLLPGEGTATSIWPASGIALGAVLLWGGDLLPGVWLGAFGIAVLKSFSDGMPPSIGVALLQDALVGVGSMLEAWIGLRVIGRRPDGPQPFGRVIDVLRLGAIGALLASAVGATLGTAVMHAMATGTVASWGPMWLTWWMGDAAGIVLFTPLMLAWIQPRGPEAVASRREQVALIIVFAIVSLVGVEGWLGNFGSYLLSYALAVCALWTALRMGTRATTTALLAVSAALLAATVAGRGPFRASVGYAVLARMDAFVLLIALVSLVLNASQREWRDAEAKLRGAYDDLEQRVQERSRELSAANAELTRQVQERRRAEETVRVSEARLRAAFENVPFDLWILDRSGTYIFQNPVSKRIAGDISGMRPEQLTVPQDVWARWRENYERAFAGEIVNWEGSYDHHGEREYRREALAPIKLDGATIGVVGIGIDVTAQHYAENKLRESEERFRLLAEQSHDLICLHEPDGRYIYVSPSSERLLGYAPSELIGRDPYELFHAEDRDRIEREAHHLNLRGVERTRIAYRIRRKNGAYTWFDTFTSVLRDASGRVHRLQTFSRDISEQRRIEDALRTIAAGTASPTSADFFRSLVRHLSEALGVRGALIAEVPEAAPGRLDVLAAWTGSEFAERVAFPIEGSPWADVFETGATFIGRGAAGAFAGPALLSDESIESVYCVPLSDARQRPLGVLAALHDTPLESSEQLQATMSIFAARASAELERLRSEQHLQEREEMYRLLFESELNAVVIVDMTTFRLVEANDAMLRLYGYAREEIPALRPVDMSAEPEKTTAAVRAVAREGLVMIDERQHRKKDGTIFPVELYTRTFTLRGRLMSCAVIRDLTERRRADAERQRLAAQIQQAQKLESLGVLAGGIAHDFNNLLVGILGNAGLALLELPDGSPTRETIAQIERAAVRAADLTRQMLAYSGKGRFVIERLDLSTLVREMLKLVQSIVSKKAMLTLQLTEPLAPVEADATQLRQVVMNLITNASDALGDEPGHVTISTGVVRADRSYLASAYLDEQLPEGEYVFLQVVDSGIGMDAETRARIFDPFFTTKFTGRGLGLAAVLGIVRGHHGTIHVESEPGAGSTFRLLLPRASSVTTRPAETLPLPTPLEWRGKGTILLVDDEPGVLSAARRILERSGLTVVTATDGREAVDAFSGSPHPIDVVLLDMTMPRMGGEETMRALRQLRPDVPVILSSGFSEQEVAERFAGERPSGFVQKPYRPADLMDAIRRALDAR